MCTRARRGRFVNKLEHFWESIILYIVSPRAERPFVFSIGTAFRDDETAARTFVRLIRLNASNPDVTGLQLSGSFVRARLRMQKKKKTFSALL